MRWKSEHWFLPAACHPLFPKAWQCRIVLPSYLPRKVHVLNPKTRCRGVSWCFLPAKTPNLALFTDCRPQRRYCLYTRSLRCRRNVVHLCVIPLVLFGLSSLVSKLLSWPSRQDQPEIAAVIENEIDTQLLYTRTKPKQQKHKHPRKHVSKSRTRSFALAPEQGIRNVGALIIRIGFGGAHYSPVTDTKEPQK